jgi:hypothetical protein
VSESGGGVPNPVLLQLEPYIAFLNLTGVVGLLPVFVPSVVAALLVAPLPLASIALVWLSRGRWTLNGRRSEHRPSLTVPFLIPSIGMVAGTVQLFPPVDWQAPLAVAAAIGIATALAVSVAEVRSTGRAAFIAFSVAIGTGWGWGLVALANGGLDSAPAQTFHTTLVDKWIHHGKSTSLHFRLAPWGPFSQEQDVQVSDAVYYRIAIGGAVCPALHSGALGWRWYFVEPCETAV